MGALFCKTLVRRVGLLGSVSVPGKRRNQLKE